MRHAPTLKLPLIHFMAMEQYPNEAPSTINPRGNSWVELAKDLHRGEKRYLNVCKGERNVFVCISAFPHLTTWKKKKKISLLGLFI